MTTKKKKDPEIPEAGPRTKREIYEEAIGTIPLVPDFEVPPGFPIPLRNAVIIKQLTGAKGGDEMETTASGIILQANIGSNVVIPYTGVVYAVGIDCSDYLVPGQKVIYNRWANEEIMIKGEVYLRVNEATDIYGILPPETWMRAGYKDDRWLFREKRKKEFADFETRKAAHDANVKDKQTELAKSNPGRKIILLGKNGGKA